MAWELCMASPWANGEVSGEEAEAIVQRGAEESGEDSMDCCNGYAWGQTGVWVLRGANGRGGGGCRMALRGDARTSHMPAP